MQILIDADACPVTEIVIRQAKAHSLPLVLLCDTSHILSPKYGEVRVIGQGADAVDLALFNCCKKGDLVITQDYGVAAMVLGKGARALCQTGMEYTADNIERLLMERHLAGKARRGHEKVHLKGPKKRTPEDDERFEAALCRILSEMTAQQGETNE